MAPTAEALARIQQLLPPSRLATAEPSGLALEQDNPAGVPAAPRCTPAGPSSQVLALSNSDAAGNTSHEVLLINHESRPRPPPPSPLSGTPLSSAPQPQQPVPAPPLLPQAAYPLPPLLVGFPQQQQRAPLPPIPSRAAPLSDMLPVPGINTPPAGAGSSRPGSQERAQLYQGSRPEGRPGSHEPQQSRSGSQQLREQQFGQASPVFFGAQAGVGVGGEASVAHMYGEGRQVGSAGTSAGSAGAGARMSSFGFGACASSGLCLMGLGDGDEAPGGGACDGGCEVIPQEVIPEESHLESHLERMVAAPSPVPVMLCQNDVGVLGVEEGGHAAGEGKHGDEGEEGEGEGDVVEEESTLQVAGLGVGGQNLGGMSLVIQPSEMSIVSDVMGSHATIGMPAAMCV